MDFLFMMMQGHDGVDLEINMNGSKSKYEDDDLDNMVFLIACQFFFCLPLCFLRRGWWANIFISLSRLLPTYSPEVWSIN